MLLLCFYVLFSFPLLDTSNYFFLVEELDWNNARGIIMEDVPESNSSIGEN